MPRQLTEEEKLFCDNCWKKVVHCYGTSTIACLLAKRLTFWKRILEFCGVSAPPFSAGLAYGIADNPSWQLTLFLVSISSVGFYLLTTWSVLSNWPDQIAKFYKSEKENRELSQEFEDLVRQYAVRTISPSDVGCELIKIREKFEGIDKRDKKRTDEDTEIFPDRQSLKQYGMRAALRQFRCTCVGCGQVPENMKPTNCDICGNFPKCKWRI